MLSLLAIPALTIAAEDPPSRVARLSHIEGEVSMAPAGTQEWGEAVLNRPLTSEDRLFVDRDARAELQVGTATIHLDAESEFSFIDLDDDAMTMNLTEGRATIRIVRKRENEQIEVNTPNASIALLHPGEYSIEVNEEGEATVVKARSGEAEVAGEGKAYTVRANEIGVFRGAEELTADINKVGPRTAFETWANDRARRDERSASSRYVGEGVIGYEDLDENGEWVSEPEYGHVWRPTYVAAGWAPYRFGRWAWVSPWGWTWIDDARWGFAPFHYGRWAYVRHRWCWVPGPRHVRAVYAPALVAWTSGPHVSVNVSFGHGIGWFPLGPREVYIPGYWHTRRYIHSVNVSNTVIINNTYINNAYRGRYRDIDYRYRGRPDAVTVVDREHFVRGRPIRGDYRRVDDRELRRWNDDARPPAIAPDRDSIRAAQPRTPRNWDSNRSDRPVVARREQPNRVGFDAERRAIEANGGRPVARTQLINRNPKEGSNVRIARAVRSDEQSASGAGSVGRVPDDKAGRRFGREGALDSQRESAAAESVNDARERAVERRAGVRERTGRVERDASNNAIQRMEATEDNARRESRAERSSGSAPQIDAQRRDRGSSDWAEQRAQRVQQQEQSRSVEAHQRDQQQRDAGRDAARREAQRAQREAATPERSSARFEQRGERAAAAPERAQPRAERATPQPRSMPENRSGNPKAQGARGGERQGSARGERGAQRER
ncbi:MAG TPA: DUF6600 domain-containing protein [Steroidobacteraceae bacterium]|nr:DUF6600 domain-containing protein [Steroidobacteraceae bacterium]